MVMRNAKVGTDERWGSRWTQNFQENKKCCGRFINGIRKGTSKR